MKYVLFSGSLRADSLNKKLLLVSQKNLISSGHEVELVDIKSLSIPVYDGDIEATGIPEGVKKLGEKIQAAQAIIISTPEYNGSIAGSFKNTVDWISRLRPMPLEGKPLLLLGASPGGFAAIRGLSASRIPLENVGAFVYPQVFGLGKAHEAFSSENTLVDAATQKRLSDLLAQFNLFAKKLG